MGEFIRVSIDEKKCGQPNEIKSWIDVCPVGIFEVKNGTPSVVKDNEDECTLCGLCLQSCPEGAIIIKKLYEK